MPPYAAFVFNVKKLGAFASLLLLSACASFPGGEKNAAAAMSEQEVADQTMQMASLKAEVARLKSQNARLANEVLALQRERDTREEQHADELAEASLPPAPEVLERIETPAPNAVVDDAEPEVIAKTDVPVQLSPRLVQPTFASNETVFENEVGGDEIKTESVLYGVHLASYRGLAQARAGWRQLQRENPDELGLLEPRVESVIVQEKGQFLRLIGGGFAAKDKAEALCAQLKTREMFCSVAGFSGERLSLKDTDS